MVEGVLGAGRLLILYVAGAYAAAFAEYLDSPESTVPVIGASGAVSAVLGAYAIYFGNRTAPSGRFLSSETRTLLWRAAAWLGLTILIGIVLKLSDERRVGEECVRTFRSWGGAYKKKNNTMS